MALERVVIVGGGILGTMHALEASRRGWEVIHLEADPGPRRASVRNFGLIWVSGRAPGAELDLAFGPGVYGITWPRPRLTSDSGLWAR
jgi:glycine/D-amino acid oxidase-like deaminating enzyme